MPDHQLAVSSQQSCPDGPGAVATGPALATGLACTSSVHHHLPAPAMSESHYQLDKHFRLLTHCLTDCLAGSIHSSSCVQILSCCAAHQGHAEVALQLFEFCAF